MHIDDIVGVHQAVSEGFLQKMVTLSFVVVLPRIRPSNVDHANNWKWKVSSCGMNWLRNF